MVRFAFFTTLEQKTESEVVNGNTITTNSYLVHEDEISPIERTFVNSTTNNGLTTYSFNPKPFETLTISPTATTDGNSKFYIFFDYALSPVKYINEQIIEYVDSALIHDSNYNTIELGATNLLFSPDFQINLTKNKNEV